VAGRRDAAEGAEHEGGQLGIRRPELLVAAEQDGKVLVRAPQQMGALWIHEAEHYPMKRRRLLVLVAARLGHWCGDGGVGCETGEKMDWFG
jgi:hypothetical protein